MPKLPMPNQSHAFKETNIIHQRDLGGIWRPLKEYLLGDKRVALLELGKRF